MALFSESWFADTITMLIGVMIMFYLYAKRTYTYWERNGFEQFPGVSYLFGHFTATFLRKEFIAEPVTKIYHATSAPFIGIYSLLKPILLIRDPELIRSVLIKDFAHFTDRGVHCNEEYDPLSGHLFALPGQRWKNLRSKLSPTFTSGKLKAMFSTIVNCGSTLQNELDQLAQHKKLLNVREMAAGFTTNIIASVAFGIEVDAITDPNTEFRVCGRKIFESSILNAIRSFGFFVAPKLLTIIHMKVVDSRVESFLRAVVKQSLEHREKNRVVRKDFFQLLVQLRNNGTVQLDDEWETVIKADESQKTLTEDEIAAQAFVFFAAGFETSSSTLSFCLYELAKNPDIQRRVHDEIDRVLHLHNEQITYESITQLKYLDACIDETLRKYPILPLLNRECVKEYQLPDTNKIVKKGVQVFIPVLALHMDEKYYKNPKQFDPERFSEENLNGKNLINRPYLPFGDGPRNCIGLRLGKMQTKVGLLMMLQKFRFELRDCDRKGEVQIDPNIFLMAPKEKLLFNVFQR